MFSTFFTEANNWQEISNATGIDLAIPCPETAFKQHHFKLHFSWVSLPQAPHLEVPHLRYHPRSSRPNGLWAKVHLSMLLHTIFTALCHHSKMFMYLQEPRAEQHDYISIIYIDTILAHLALAKSSAHSPTTMLWSHVLRQGAMCSFQILSTREGQGHVFSIVWSNKTHRF